MISKINSTTRMPSSSKTSKHNNTLHLLKSDLSQIFSEAQEFMLVNHL